MRALALILVYTPLALSLAAFEAVERRTAIRLSKRFPIEDKGELSWTLNMILNVGIARSHAHEGEGINQPDRPLPPLILPSSDRSRSTDLIRPSSDVNRSEMVGNSETIGRAVANAG